MQQSSPTAGSAKVVCFCNTTRVWGGGEKWHYEMAVLLRQRGYRILTITRKGSALQKKYLRAGMENIAFNISNFSLLNPLIKNKLQKVFTAHQVTTLIMNLPGDLKTAGPAARRAGTGQIIYRRGSAIPVKDTALNRYLYRKVADLVLVNSEATKNTILGNNAHLIPADKIKVIYNGIDLREFDKRPVDREKYPRKAPFVIGNIGRLVPQKGQHLLVEAAAILKKRNIPFRMLIGGEGKEEDSLRKLIQAKGLEEEVTLTGFAEDVKSFMAALDVFALSSYWEGFGYVLAEAMSAAKPVVAFDISSNPELVCDNTTGLLVPQGNVSAFADNLAWLREHPAEAHAMGRAGRKRVEQMFSLETALDKLEQLISE
jgi:glycosyltransferase involved in cell wall biosynthesis